MRRGRVSFGEEISTCETSSQCGSIRKASTATNDQHPNHDEHGDEG